MQQLLEAGAPVDHLQETTQATALRAATQAGGLDVVRLLLRMGADANHLDKKGTSPLFVACEVQHLHSSAPCAAFP